MNRCPLLSASLVLFATAGGFAQTSSTSNTSGQIPITASNTLNTQTPAQNVRIGAVSGRSPSKIVEAAIARHNGVVNSLGTRSSLNTGSSGGATSSTSSNSSNSDLSSLLSTLLSSNTNGDLNGVISQLLSSGALSSLLTNTTTGTTSTGTTNNSNLNIPSNITPDVLALLQSAGIDLNSLFGSTSSAGTTATNGSSSAGTTATNGSSSAGTTATNGSTNNFTVKPRETSQTTTTTTQPSNSGTNPTWMDRWISTLLNTTFNSLTLAFRTQQFITAVADTVFLPFFQDLANSNKASSATSKPVNADAQDGAPADSGSVLQMAPASDGLPS